MATTVNFVTRVVLVLQADLSLISPGVFQLDLDTFHRDLRGLEAGGEGVVFAPTHNHNPPVTVGSITLARVIEMINGYTVEFEDVGSPYAVNLEGANSNVADVAVVNNVSVRPNNSAGLVDTGVLDEMNELINRTQFLIESQRAGHASLGGAVFYWDPVNGDDTNDALDKSRPAKTFAHIHDNLVTSNAHDVIFALSVGPITVTERLTFTKNWVFLRGPGRDFLLAPTDDAADTIAIDGARGVEVDSFAVRTGPGSTARHAVRIKNGADDAKISSLWIDSATGDAVHVDDGDHHLVLDVFVDGVAGHGVFIDNSIASEIVACRVFNVGGDAYRIMATNGAGSTKHVVSKDNLSQNNVGQGHFIGTGVQTTTIRFVNEIGDNITDNGTDTKIERDELVGLIWDVAVADHLAVGSTGEALSSSTGTSRVSMVWTRKLLPKSTFIATFFLIEGGAFVPVAPTARLSVTMRDRFGKELFTQTGIAPNAEGFFSVSQAPFPNAVTGSIDGSTLASFATITDGAATLADSVEGLSIPDFGTVA